PVKTNIACGVCNELTGKAEGVKRENKLVILVISALR
ncbi:hypothetical protein LSH36_193g09024, partial [Paralvinella palmiformis]